MTRFAIRLAIDYAAERRICYKSIMTRLAGLLLIAVASFGLDNSIRIYDTSGSAQTARPFTVLMVFIQGEFPFGTYPKPRVEGNSPRAWQVDVKSRWPDGSILTAYVSFPVSLRANGSVKVDFVPDTNACHLGPESACEAAALSQGAMLNFLDGKWNAQVRGTANSISYTVDAKTMIIAGAWRYWLRGPVVTRVIVEDMSTALAYDFGWRWDGSAWQAPSDDRQKGIHPIFELSFYPGWSGVEVGYKLEVPWRTRLIKTTRDKEAAYQFDLEFLAGPSPSVVYSKTGYNLTNKAAVSYLAWSGTSPDEVFVDRNFSYLIATRILPSYDLTVQVSPSYINNELSKWPANVGTDDQGRPDPRSCTTQNPCAWIKTDWPGTGDHPNFGIVPRWQIAYLYAMGDSRFSVSQRKDMFEKFIVASAEAALTTYTHLRESYTNVTPAYRNYLNWPTDQETPSFGRIFSISAFPESRSYNYENTGTYPALYSCTNCPATNKPWIMSVSHYPALLPIPYLLTGRYVYLSSLIQWGAVILGSENPGYSRHYDWGIYYASGEPRLASRPLKSIFWAYLLAPDSPERSYFAEKLKNNDAAYEGVFDIEDGLYADQVVKNCAGQVIYTSSQIFNSSHQTSRPNGKRKVFVLSGPDVIINVKKITVNSSVQTFGIYRQDTGKQWYFIPGSALIIQDETGQPLTSTDVLQVSYDYGRSASPWCKGFAMRKGLSNPLPMIGIGSYMDTQGYGERDTTQTSPWMVSYLAITLGWARQTQALKVGNGYLFEKSGAKLGRFYIDGMLHPRMPILYSGDYHTPTGDALGLITTWERYIAARNPPIGLISDISSSAGSFTINCRCGVPGCINVPGSEAIFKIDDEYIRTCSKSTGANTTTFTVCPGGRGYWGTKPAPHTTASVVNAEWRTLGDELAGHTYPNLWVNALALYYDVTGLLGSGLEAYQKAIRMGKGLEKRASDQRYAIVPRVEPYRLNVIITSGKAEISYEVPGEAACRYAVTATQFASSDDASDELDRGGLRTRRIVLDSLRSGTYRYRVTCGGGRKYGIFTIP